MKTSAYIVLKNKRGDFSEDCSSFRFNDPSGKLSAMLQWSNRVIFCMSLTTLNKQVLKTGKQALVYANKSNELVN